MDWSQIYLLYFLKSKANYKKGPEGALTFARGELLRTGIFRVEALKPVGSGDAFMAGLLAGLSKGLDLKSAVQQGSANAAVVVSKVGCSIAMPDQAELDAFIQNHPGIS